MPRPTTSSSPRRAARHAEPRLAPVAFAALLAAAGLPAHAAPATNQLPVSSGSTPINAVINANTGTASNPVMNITQTQSASNRGVIEWSSFSIGSAARVNIVQPNAQSVLINRVVGPSTAGASEIYGALNANGRVFLVNPAGVVFGPGAQVNVGSLVATSLDLTSAMTDNNYAGALGAGAIVFGPGSGTSVEVMDTAVIQAGAGGSVLLVSDAELRQNGAIEAAQGRIALAGADAAEIVPLGTSGFVDLVIVSNTSATNQVTLGSTSSTLAAGGSIVIGGRLEDTGRNDILSISGTVSAASSTGNGGSVLIDAGDGSASIGSGALVSVASTAPEGRGGRLGVNGQSITLDSGNGPASLSADGSGGGGDISLGGTGTRALRVDNGITVSADATANGNGGNIWARATHSAGTSIARTDYGVAEFYGTLRARGGPDGGNGGHIETSGTSLNTALATPSTGSVAATIDARARSIEGRAGSWSIDPFDVTISNAAPTGFPGSFTPTAPGANLRAADIAAVLDTGTSVDITTGSASSGSDAGNITLTSGTSISRNAGGGPATLQLRAHDSVVLQSGSSITGTAANPLNIHLYSDLDGSGGGRVELQGPVALGTGGGNIQLSGGTDPLTGFATGATGVAGVSLGSATLDTVGAAGSRGDVLIRGAGTASPSGSGSGVSASGGSITAHNITIVGQSADSSAVALSGLTLDTGSGAIDIRGVATRAGLTSSQAIGVELSGVTANTGSGSLLIAGRGDDNNITTLSAPATGLQYSNLHINTAAGPSGPITLAGEAAHSSGAGITFQDTESGGLVVSAGVSVPINTLSDISLGAISSDGLAFALGVGTGFNTSVSTDGALNFRPLGVDSNGALVESTATPISITPIATGDTGFIVDPAWLQTPVSGSPGFGAGRGVVVGSSLHSGAISVDDNALSNHATLSLTLQNQGTGSGGIALGSGNSLRDLGLMTAGDVSQGGALTVSGKLVIEGAPASVVDLSEANTIGMLAFDPPDTLLVSTQGDLTVDAADIASYDAGTSSFASLSITGSSATNTVALRSLGGSVLVNQPITMTGTGTTLLDLSSLTAVTFAAGAQPVKGAGGVVRAWAPSITGLAGATNHYGCQLDSEGCASGLAPPSAPGTYAIYPTQPTLSVTAANISGTIGTALPALGYTASGLINGDTAAQALTGALGTTATASSPPGTYAITQNTLVSPTGYLISFTPGQLTLALGTRSPDSDAVRADHLSEFRSDVYGRNLSRPFVCTASSLVRDDTARESGADPLTLEWGKVRHQPQLSGCLDVNNAGQCAAF